MTMTIVGASVAGVSAIRSLRAHGYTGRICLVDSDPWAPYDKPPLSKGFLLGTRTRGDMSLISKTDLDTLAVDLVHGTANGIDTERRAVALDDGRRLAYERLVIATGSALRSVPDSWRLDGILKLRSLDDAVAIKAELVAGARVMVIGAGFIGVEVAMSAAALGARVSLVDMSPGPLWAPLGPMLSPIVAGVIADAGVVEYFGVSVVALEGQPGRYRAELSDGSRIEADVVVAGLGAEPRIDWLGGSAVDTDRAVTCNAQCQTTVPDIFAAGDVAAWHNSLYSRRMQVPHWTNAVQQGAYVGKILQSPAPEAEAPYTHLPYFWTDLGPHRLQVVGVVSPTDSLVWVEKDPASESFVALHVDKVSQIVNAVSSMNDAAGLARWRAKVLRAYESLTPHTN